MLGLEMAGIEALAHVEKGKSAECRVSSDQWNSLLGFSFQGRGDVREFSAKGSDGVGSTRATACCLRRLRRETRLEPLCATSPGCQRAANFASIRRAVRARMLPNYSSTLPI